MKKSHEDSQNTIFGWWWHLCGKGEIHEESKKTNEFGMTHEEMVEETLIRR